MLAAEIKTARNERAMKMEIETNPRFEFKRNGCGRDKASRWKSPRKESGLFAPLSDEARRRDNGGHNVGFAEKKPRGRRFGGTHRSANEGEGERSDHKI